MKTEREVAEGAVLIVAPIGKDATLARSVLEQAGIAARTSATLAHAATQLRSGTNAILIEEEALVASEVELLLESLNAQPPWSDIPLIILSSAGAGKYVSVRATDIFGSQANVTFLERPLGTVTLISAIRAALRARRRQYQLRDLLEQREAAFTGISDAFAALDRDWRYIYVNETAAKYAERSRDEMIGRKIWEIYPEAVGGNFYNAAHRALDTQQPQMFEQYYEQWECWLETRIYPASDGVVVFRANINERKRQEELMGDAERKVRESEAVLRLALEAAGAGTFDYYARPREMRLGPRARQLVGFNVDEQLSLDQIIAVLHPEDREKVLRALRNAARAAGETINVEFRVIRASDAEERWIAARGRALLGPDGRGERCVGTMLDVTDRKNAEFALQRAKSAAETANRAKDQFLAMLSHELRTPLTPVLMTTAALQHDPSLDDRFRADIDLIQRNIHLEASLIDDLLDVTRISHGKLELRPDATDIHSLIEHALTISAAELTEKGMQVTRDFRAHEHHCWADAARLQQVFWNIIKNAVKFTPPGGHLHIATWNDNAQHVIIQFADNGVGIDPEVLPRIFNAFEQGGRTTTTKYGGLGLGLAISKSIIDAHDGQITADSAGRDGGAAFTITLQAIATSLLDGPAYVLAPRGRTAAGRRVLLVEDHDDTARVLRRILEHAGYEVALAATVAEARECGANQHFDLLISDIGLSDGSGLDLMRELRATTAIEGIALSGFGTEDDVAASRAAGFAEHLTKPIGWERLRGAIERIVSGAPAEQQDELSPA